MFQPSHTVTVQYVTFKEIERSLSAGAFPQNFIMNTPLFQVFFKELLQFVKRD